MTITETKGYAAGSGSASMLHRWSPVSLAVMLAIICGDPILAVRAATTIEEGQSAPTSTSVTAALKPGVQRGMAAWYGEEFAGRTTANGEIFEPLLLTAAHRTLPFGSIVEVKNTTTGRAVRVRINDRGPFVAERLIDVSYAAAKEIGLIDSGSGDVEVSVISLGRGDLEPPAPYTVTLAQTKPQSKSAPSSIPARVLEGASQAPLQPNSPTVTPDAAATQAMQPMPSQPAEAQPLPTQMTVAPPRPSSPSQPASAAATPPQVEFPLPGDLAARPAPPNPSPAPPAVIAEAPATPVPAPADFTATGSAAGSETLVSNVQVVEERQGSESRRQVTSDGRAVQSVPVESSEAVPAAPGRSAAEAADRPAAQASAASRSVTRGKRFVVQVGAFGVEANAKALAELLLGFGLDCHIVKDTLYRVRMGPFDTRDEAIRVRADLETKGLSAILLGE